MAISNKNIVITPALNVADPAVPKIVFSGADASTANQDITLNVYPQNQGTLSFEGINGQVFSINNNVTGTIFSVNDVSGIPSIEVLDTGTVKVAQYSGNTLIGTAADDGNKFQIAGTMSITCNTCYKTNARSLYGPNTSWSSCLYVGGDGTNGFTRTASIASVVTTNGNLHLDAGSDKAMYLNYYSGTAGVQIGNGASAVVACLNTAGAICGAQCIATAGMVCAGTCILGNSYLCVPNCVIAGGTLCGGAVYTGGCVHASACIMSDTMVCAGTCLYGPCIYSTGSICGLYICAGCCIYAGAYSCAGICLISPIVCGITAICSANFYGMHNGCATCAYCSCCALYSAYACCNLPGVNFFATCCVITTGGIVANGGGDASTSMQGGISLWSTATGTTSWKGFKCSTAVGWGVHGSISANEYATYNIMDTSTRGWIWRNATTSTNQTSISNTGVFCSCNCVSAYVVCGSTAICAPSICATTCYYGPYYNSTGYFYGPTIYATSCLCSCGVFQGLSNILTSGGCICAAGNICSAGMVQAATCLIAGTYMCSATCVQMAGYLYAGGWVCSAGGVCTAGNVVAYNTSDCRLKKYIKTIPCSLGKVAQLRGVEYDWNEEGIKQNGGVMTDDGKSGYFQVHDVGVIAQDVEKVMPEAVRNRDDGYKGVNYEKLIPLLINAINEQQEQITTLKTLVGQLI